MQHRAEWFSIYHMNELIYVYAFWKIKLKRNWFVKLGAKSTANKVSQKRKNWNVYVSIECLLNKTKKIQRRNRKPGHHATSSSEYTIYANVQIQLIQITNNGLDESI